jgi:hypothetical protein
VKQGALDDALAAVETLQSGGASSMKVEAKLSHADLLTLLRQQGFPRYAIDTLLTQQTGSTHQQPVNFSTHQQPVEWADGEVRSVGPVGNHIRDVAKIQQSNGNLYC